MRCLSHVMRAPVRRVIIGLGVIYCLAGNADAEAAPEFGEKMILAKLFQTATTMVASTDRSIIAFAEKEIVLLDVATAKRIDSFTRLGDVSALSFSTDDKTLYVAGRIKSSATIESIDIKNRSRSTVKDFGKETSIHAVGPSSKGTYLAAVCSREFGTLGEVVVIDPVTNAMVFSVSEDAERIKDREEGYFVGAFSFAFATDESHLFCGHGDGTVSVWDMKSKKQLSRTRLGTVKEHVSSMLLSKDGSHLVASSIDEVFVVATKTMRVIAHFDDHVNIVTSLAISSDGNLLFTNSSDCAVRCYSLKTHRLVARFKRVHTQAGHSVVCVPCRDKKGLLIASGLSEGYIWCWPVKATE